MAAENAIAVGGGVYNDDGAGNLTINDSVIEDNSVTATHGGTGAGADALGGGVASGDPIVVNRSTMTRTPPPPTETTATTTPASATLAGAVLRSSMAC